MPRTKGSKNHEIEQVADIALVVCSSCGSTERSPYQSVRRQPFKGIDERGVEYDTIIRRNCRCLKCGQWRTEREYAMEERHAEGLA